MHDRLERVEDDGLGVLDGLEAWVIWRFVERLA